MKHCLILLIVAPLLFMACSGPTPGPEPDNNHPQYSATHLPGWVRVKFREGLSPDIQAAASSNSAVRTGLREVDELMETLGATRIERVFSDGGKFSERRRKYGFHLWYDFYVGETLQPITRSAYDLSQLECVETTELIPVIRSNSAATPSFEYRFDDPFLYYQWNLHNYGSGGPAGDLNRYNGNFKRGMDVNVFNAWDITTGSQDVIVAVLDSGIDFKHPDLAANIWANAGETAENGADDDNNGYIDDIYGFRFEDGPEGSGSGIIQPLNHGTHCAGIIAAASNNNTGLAGIAGGNGTSPGVKIMICQIAHPANPSEYPGNYDDMQFGNKAAEAFLYAAENGAVIASNSWGGVENDSYRLAIRYFIETAGLDEHGTQTGPIRGGIVVFSAGNESSETPQYPAAWDEVISVAWLDPDFCIHRGGSIGSNFGSWIDLAAPGGYTASGKFGNESQGGIYSTVVSGKWPGGTNYAFRQGSSMAAPHVAGVAALLISHYGGISSGVTAADIRQMLEASAYPVNNFNSSSYSAKMGSGLVDAYCALTYTGIHSTTLPEQVVNPDVSRNMRELMLSFRVPEDAWGKPPLSYDLYWSRNELTAMNLYALTPSDETGLITIDNNLGAGEVFLRRIDEIEPYGDYFFAIVSRDRFGRVSEPVHLTASLGEPAPDPVTGDSRLNITNPVTATMTVRTDGTYGNTVSATIYNSAGQKVFSDHITFASGGIFDLDISKLSSGSYIFILSGNGSKVKLGFVKL